MLFVYYCLRESYQSNVLKEVSLISSFSFLAPSSPRMMGKQKHYSCEQSRRSIMASLVALDSVASSYTLPDGADKLLPSSVVSMISPACQETGLPKLLSVLLLSVQTIGENLRNASYTSVAVGSTNLFGDNQLDVDVKTDAVVFQNLQASGLVALASSEEQPTYVECGGENFSVGFDPLDGSSIIGANFAVGTILGIYPGRGFVDRTGRDQVAAMISTYGPRMSVALALSSTATVDGQPITLELTYSSTGWFVSVAKMVIHPTCKTFAPGNLRATADNPAYRALVNYWITSKYTLRYSGGLVPDVYHILIKQGGVLSNASSPQAKAKLRLLYEAAPIALIIEAAGGGSCVCPSEAGEDQPPVSLLDVTITDLHRRVGVCYGSSEEIARCRAMLFPEYEASEKK
jgi:sedoheptulose-bisphosphatase